MINIVKENDDLLAQLDQREGSWHGNLN